MLGRHVEKKLRRVINTPGGDSVHKRGKRSTPVPAEGDLRFRAPNPRTALGPGGDQVGKIQPLLPRQGKGCRIGNRFPRIIPVIDGSNSIVERLRSENRTEIVMELYERGDGVSSIQGDLFHRGGFRNVSRPVHDGEGKKKLSLHPFGNLQDTLPGKGGDSLSGTRRARGSEAISKTPRVPGWDSSRITAGSLMRS